MPELHRSRRTAPHRRSRPFTGLLFTVALSIGLGSTTAVARPLDEGCSHPGHDDRCETAVHIWDDSPGLWGWEATTAVAADPVREQLVTVGYLEGPQSIDLLIEATDVHTGVRRWQTTYDSPAGRWDTAYAVAAAPESGRAVVVGTSSTEAAALDVASVLTVDLSDGRILWSASYDTSAANRDTATAVALSPDERTAYVVGASDPLGPGRDDGFLRAYDTETGSLLWSRIFTGLAWGREPRYPAPRPVIATDRDGVVVAITREQPCCPDLVVSTAAYTARTGTMRWDGGGWPTSSAPVRFARASDGTVFWGAGAASASVVAQRLSDGAVSWSREYRGPVAGSVAVDLASSPDGSQLWLLAASRYTTTSHDDTDPWSRTYRLDPRDGSILWEHEYTGATTGRAPGGLLQDHVAPVAMTYDPDSDSVLTVAVHADHDDDHNSAQSVLVTSSDGASGARRWTARWSAPTGLGHAPVGIEVVAGAVHVPGSLPPYSVALPDRAFDDLDVVEVEERFLVSYTLP